jgi:hypothetical protein
MQRGSRAAPADKETVMEFVLVVVRPFGSYRRGDLIADQADIERVLQGGHAHDVVRVTSKEH